MTILFSVFIVQLLTVQAIWPQPKTIEQGNTPIILSKDFQIIPSKRLINQFNFSKDLKLAINKTLTFIKNDHHRPLKIDRDESVKKLIKNDDKMVLDTLELRITDSKSNNWLMNSFKNYYWSWKNDDETISLNEITDEIRKPLNDRDESYEIQIGNDQFETPDCVTFHGFIEASNALGLLRGLQTFSQLVYATNITTDHQEVNKVVNQEETPKENVDEEQKSEEIEQEEGEGEVNTFQYLYGPITIKDSPSFPYRGILLDTSRNYYPIPDLLRTIEVMSWSKLSTFHWHIVDAQSWPLEIPHLPNLSKKGAYSNKEIYTINDVKNVIEFANSLGIDVMIEIDSPGHTSIIGESFIDLIACKDFQPWNLFAAEPPAGQLRIADENALELIESIYGFVCDQFPGTLFSSGGDEVNHKCYEEDEITQNQLRLKNLTLNKALEHFIKKSHIKIKQSGKTPVVWEELILEEDLNLNNKETIIAVWKSSNNVKKVIDLGFRIIHAASDFAYLDCGLGGWLGLSGNSWCDPFKTWQKIYSFDPYANITIQQRKLVTGGQVSLWSEQADRQNLDSLLWPRALAAAELYWTGLPDDPSITINQRLLNALPRLHDMRYRMVQRGIQATALQPHWCALRPGQCNMP